eukprot:Phypoly_transcript_00398.p1 GENE.Phypoly_transcript_00398~~Phypoly_transcript_00398.p1  ORF type:complete len:1639 (+),score=189.82 Phypoly_transcript_00398:311-4918(+)
MSNGHQWHASLCPGVLPASANQPPLDSVFLPYECTCLNQRLQYWAMYPDTKIVDPLYHYVKYGYAAGYIWECNCGESDIFINDTVCQTCAPALQAFEAQYLIDGAFGNYYDFYWIWGVMFHCELCTEPSSTTTGGASVTTTTTGSTSTTTGGGGTAAPPASEEDYCDCLAARNDYYVRYVDVMVNNQDPFSHFNNVGRFQGRTWNCTLCSFNNLYINQSFANCTAAAQRYMSDYGIATQDPFSHYLATYHTNYTYAWHYELCDVPLPDLDVSCICIGSVTSYYQRYPDSSAFDAAYHYKWFGQALGYTWDCSTCSSSSFKPSDSVCNCPEAASRYATATGYTGTSAFSLAATYGAVYGNPWHCESCTTNPVDPTTSLTCNCTAARSAYSAQYQIGTVDPWTHYTTTGAAAGNFWDCPKCNDTCPGIYMPGVWLDDGQASSFTAASTVTIPAGCYYPISSDLTLTSGNLYIYGTLRCANLQGEYTFNSLKIWLYGSFQCGTVDAPFAGELSITLYGAKPATSDAQSDRVGGDKSLAVLPGGLLELHGAKLVSWTRLAAQADAGATTITVQDDIDWETGDEVIITSTAPYYLGLDTSGMDQIEERTIASISGRTLVLTEQLSYQHLAEVHHLPPSNLTYEKRAEVALISGRNIRIQSDDSFQSSGFGAHVMLLSGARGYVSGIQLSQVGQLAMIARYPWHWHLLGNINSGQYFRNNTVRNSSNRCCTIHGTNNTVLQHNVCYQFIGHGYFLEDGVETGNLLDGNLGAYAIRPAPGMNIIPSDVLQGPHAYGPAIFWLSNPNNTLTNNVGSGSQGSVFWIEPEATTNPAGHFTNVGYYPNLAPWGPVNNNFAHSSVMGFTSCTLAGGNPGTATFNNIWPVENLQVYGTSVGVWPCGSFQRYHDMIVVESVLGMQVPNTHYFDNVAFVDVAKTSADPPLSNAINLYDSGWVINGALFQGYNVNQTHSIFRETGAALYNCGTRTSNITLVDSPVLFGDPYNYTFITLESEWAQFVNDVDGTLTGYADHTLVSDHPMMLDSRCFRTVGSNFGYVCPMHYGELLLVYDGLSLRPGTIGRYNFSSSKGDFDASAIYFPPPTYPFYRWSAVANDDYVYVFVMPTKQPTRHLVEARIDQFSMNGDSFALEIRNINASAFRPLVGIKKSMSCIDVYTATYTQSYFWDEVNSRVCMRLVATHFSSTIRDDPYGYGSPQLFTPVNSGTSEDDQPDAHPTLVTLPSEQTCVRAMVQYWQQYPVILKGIMDAVYHYEHYGYAQGFEWHGELCATNAYYAENSTCECYAANYAYSVEQSLSYSDYSYNTSSYEDPHDNFLSNRDLRGYAYHCELCLNLPDIQGPHTLPSQCRCDAARTKYKTSNSLASSTNAVYHYEFVGGAKGLTWECDLCNQTGASYTAKNCNCSAAAIQYLQDYSEYTTYFKNDPLAHWIAYGDVYNFEWNCDLCDAPTNAPPSTTSPTNPTPVPTSKPTSNPTTTGNGQVGGPTPGPTGGPTTSPTTDTTIVKARGSAGKVMGGLVLPLIAFVFLLM